MRELNLTVPELGLVAMTRGAAGVGLGLLLAGRLSDEQRKALGWGLFLLGAATTIPLAIEVFGKGRQACEEGRLQETGAVME
ncbi:MAG TPA: hypothetical protein VFG68_08060 [Fimbriiglobus sp.]|nr:hypothetical protein [Fimbriiglobus sp.]